MNIEAKLAPALVALAVVGGAIALVVQDHAQGAAAMALLGVVAQAFLPAAVRVTATPKDGAP